MATRKTKPTGRAAKRPVRKPTTTRMSARRPAREPKATRAAAKSPARRALKARKSPETLRLRSFMPSLTVRDLGRSVDFYTRALGFVVGERWTSEGVLLGVMLVAGACRLGLSQDDWAKGREREKGMGVRLWCETAQDLEVLAARIRTAGGDTDGPSAEPWGELTVSVDDPDGYHFSFSKAKS
jgi:catechol 2,3-dioxygenase-like lactoylglutathione lyase family enzyme